MNDASMPRLQNLEVVYSQYIQKDGRRGLDWTEVAVCLVQDGISNAHESMLAASTMQARAARPGARSPLSGSRALQLALIFGALGKLIVGLRGTLGFQGAARPPARLPGNWGARQVAGWQLHGGHAA